jgi:hypothetical protein
LLVADDVTNAAAMANIAAGKTTRLAGGRHDGIWCWGFKAGAALHYFHTHRILPVGGGFVVGFKPTRSLRSIGYWKLSN